MAMKKMKIICWALIGSLAVPPVFAAQQEITQIGTISGANQLQLQKAAINERLAKAQLNFTEIYSLLGGNPWLAQTTAPNIHNVFWIDTSGTGPVLKYWDGDSWEALSFSSSGEYPIASATVSGGIKVGARLTITDGVLSADVQSGNLPTLTEGQTVIGGTGGTPTAVDTEALTLADITDKFTGTGPALCADGTKGDCGLGAGGGTWGSITGDITTQTDLEARFTAVSNQINNLITTIEAAGIDITPPALTRVAPASQTPSISADTLALDYTITDANGISQATYALNGAIPVNLTDGVGDAYTATVTGFTEGSNSLVVAARDNSSSLNLASQTLTVTYTIPGNFCSTGTGTFVGSPGDVEGFEYQEGDFCTTIFGETDAGGHISTYSANYAHSGTHGAWFAGTNAVDDWTTATIKASLATPEDSYKLEMWVKTPNTLTSYTSRAFFHGSNVAVGSGSSANGTVALNFKGNGGPSVVVMYPYIGGTGDSSINLVAQTEYRLVLNITRNAASTCEIYSSAGTLLDTLTVTTPDRATQYFTWRDLAWAYGLDDIKFDTTNP